MSSDSPDKETRIPHTLSLASRESRLEVLPEVSRMAETIRQDAKRQSAVTPVSAPKVHRKGTAKGRRRRRKIAAVAFTIACAAFFVLAAYHTAVVMRLFDAVNYVPSGGNPAGTRPPVSASSVWQVSHSDETKNILLIGCDIDRSGLSRSDSMMILSLDHTHQTIKITSLMRDMYLEIPGHGRHKLNAAYTYGGGDLLLSAVYVNFGLRIDRYICVDYAAFAALVDYVGGVDIEIEEMELAQFNQYVHGAGNRIDRAGVYAMNGQQALAYCRIRKVGTDTARTARQREVLGKIIAGCRHMSLGNAENMLAAIAPSLTTNCSREELLQWAAEGLDCRHYRTLGMRIPVDGTWNDRTIGGIWYMQIDLARNAQSLREFIYGSDETAEAMAAALAQHDSANENADRAGFEKQKQK